MNDQAHTKPLDAGSGVHLHAGGFERGSVGSLLSSCNPAWVAGGASETLVVTCKATAT